MPDHCTLESLRNSNSRYSATNPIFTNFGGEVSQKLSLTEKKEGFTLSFEHREGAAK